MDIRGVATLSVRKLVRPRGFMGKDSGVCTACTQPGSNLGSFTHFIESCPHSPNEYLLQIDSELLILTIGLNHKIAVSPVCVQFSW